MEKLQRSLVAVGRAVIPGADLAATLVDVFFPSADPDLKKAAQDEFNDLVLEMQKRLAALESKLTDQGLQLDACSIALGRYLTDQILRDHATVADATKTEALLNASARLHDSSWLTADVRRYWFTELLALTGAEIDVLRRLDEVGAIHLNVNRQGSNVSEGTEETAYVDAVLQRLVARGYLLEGGGQFRGVNTRVYSDRGAAKALVHLASPIARPAS